MRNLVKTTSGCLVTVLILMIIFSCNDPSEGVEPKHVKFKFTSAGVDSETGRGKSQSEPSSIILSVANSESVLIEDQVVPLAKFGEEYFTVSGIELPSGTYFLTKFIVLDEADIVIMAAPVEGSEKAYLVNDPLPLEFSVTNESVNEISVEIISLILDEDSPSDFGYGFATFQLNPVSTFFVDTYVVDFDTREQLSASVLVQGFNSANEVEMESTFSTYASAPLAIELLEEIAYYRFYIDQQGYYEMEYYLSQEEIARGLVCCGDAEGLTIELVDPDKFHRVQISDLFKNAWINHPHAFSQKIYSYIPLNGCTRTPWIDFGGFSPNWVSISMYTEGGGETSLVVENDNIGADFFGIFDLNASDYCAANPQNNVFEFFLNAGSGIYDLQIAFIWDKSQQQWTTASQFVQSISQGVYTDLVYETYDLNE